MTDATSNRHRHLSLPPSRATAAGHAYFQAANSDFRLFHFVIDSVLAGDWVAYVAHQALNDKEKYKALDPAKLATANESVGHLDSAHRGPLVPILRLRGLNLGGEPSNRPFERAGMNVARPSQRASAGRSPAGRHDSPISTSACRLTSKEPLFGDHLKAVQQCLAADGEDAVAEGWR